MTAHNESYVARLWRALFGRDVDVLPPPATGCIVRNGGPWWPRWL